MTNDFFFNIIIRNNNHPSITRLASLVGIYCCLRDRRSHVQTHHLAEAFLCGVHRFSPTIQRKQSEVGLIGDPVQGVLLVCFFLLLNKDTGFFFIHTVCLTPCCIIIEKSNNWQLNLHALLYQLTSSCPFNV